MYTITNCAADDDSWVCWQQKKNKHPVEIWNLLKGKRAHFQQEQAGHGWSTVMAWIWDDGEEEDEGRVTVMPGVTFPFQSSETQDSDSAAAAFSCAFLSCSYLQIL